MEGMEQPVQYFTPSLGLSGLAIYTGSDFPRWTGSAFLGGMTGQVLYRVALDGTTVTQVQRVPELVGTRVRDVRIGPDNFIYVLTESGDASLLRLEPGS